MIDEEMHVCKSPNCLPTMPYELPIHSNECINNKHQHMLISETTILAANEITPPTHLIPTDRTDVAINLGGNVDQFHRPSQVGKAWEAHSPDVGDGSLQTSDTLILQAFGVPNKKQCFEVGHAGI